jgi:hypothetical protein
MVYHSKVLLTAQLLKLTKPIFPTMEIKLTLASYQITFQILHNRDILNWIFLLDSEKLTLGQTNLINASISASELIKYSVWLQITTMEHVAIQWAV